MNQPRLIVVCGPTAAGKTEIALKIAQLVSGDLVSIDSRQAYRDMNIGTGKDIPLNYKYTQELKLKVDDSVLSVGHYSYLDRPRIWLYDMLDPSQEINPADYALAVHQAIKITHQQHRVPILVGGTGFYLESILNPPATIRIKPDEQLRTKLNKISVEDLQIKLQQIDIVKYRQLNHSDQLNPRRLIRAIEVASHEPSIHNSPKVKSEIYSQVYWIGLDPGVKHLESSIKKRVQSRLKQGFIDEVKKLSKRDSWSNTAQKTLGYQQIVDFIQHRIDLKTAQEIWIRHEYRYAKRQLTWFKNPNRSYINWFNPLVPNVAEHIVDSFKIWYLSLDEKS